MLHRGPVGIAGMTAPASASAVWGSLSPLPVSTHTIRRASPAPWTSRPATLAADAGSQKIPSVVASSR